MLDSTDCKHLLTAVLSAALSADLLANALILNLGRDAHRTVSLHLFGFSSQHIHSQNLLQNCKTRMACGTSTVSVQR